jgi:hypothetical protein
MTAPRFVMHRLQIPQAALRAIGVTSIPKKLRGERT